MTGAWASGRRRSLVLGWCLALVSVLLLSLAAQRHGPLPGDVAVGQRVQDFPPLLEGPLEWLQKATATETVVLLGGLLAGFLAVSGRRRDALVVAVALVALLVLQPAVKDVVDRPRPTAEVLERRVAFSSPSFPSGHVLGAAMVLGLGVATLPRRSLVAPVAAVIAVANGFASVYLGAHWPSDVLGGFLWAVVLLGPALAVRAVMTQYPPSAYRGGNDRGGLT